MSFAVAIAVLALSFWFTPALTAQVPAAAGTEGETGVMKWKDGKKAVFLLAYDDSCVSHLKNAIPELEKRDLVGTFYINAGNGPYQSQKANWEKIASSPAVVLGNHTYKHAGATSPEQLDEELLKANEVIYALNAGRKQPYLVSFAQPGGVPWKVEKETVSQLLTKHQLVSRPPFQGPPLSQKTLEQCLKSIDDALAKGEMGHLDFHGVGGDWHVVPMDWYIAILDRLQADSAKIWTTDHITYHKYLQERKGAKATITSVNDQQIRLALSSDADATLYDQPLTLRTRVPAGWKTCTVAQGESRATAQVTNGFAQYDAMPGAQEIVLTPAN